MLTPEQISRYQTVHRQAFGEDISISEATSLAVRLYTLIIATYTNLTKVQYEEGSYEVDEFRKKLAKGSESCDTEHVDPNPK